MTFSLRTPSIDVAALQEDHVSYKGALSERGEVALDEPPPHGYNEDRASAVIGHGPDDFATARRALEQWVMFSMPWLELTPSRPAIELGAIAVVSIRVLGVLSVVNASRITMLVDRQAADGHRYGFVYATLRSHAERGEEIFLVTHHLDDDRVEYSLAAHSRPGHWLSWLGYPATRWYQRRFRVESAEAMRAAVVAG